MISLGKDHFSQRFKWGGGRGACLSYTLKFSSCRWVHARGKLNKRLQVRRWLVFRVGTLSQKEFDGSSGWVESYFSLLNLILLQPIQESFGAFSSWRVCSWCWVRFLALCRPTYLLVFSPWELLLSFLFQSRAHNKSPPAFRAPPLTIQLAKNACRVFISLVCSKCWPEICPKVEVLNCS